MSGIVVRAIDAEAMRSEVAFYATTYLDWTILQLPSGDSFGFCRDNGRVYKLPHDECPFVVIDWSKGSKP